MLGSAFRLPVLALALALVACNAPGATGPGRDAGDSGGPSPDAGPLEDGAIPPPPPPPPPPPTRCPDHPATLDWCDDTAQSAMLRGWDSDNDGLSDYDEICVHGSNPCAVDSNGDGVSDLIRVAAGLDPAGAEPFPADDFAVVLPFEGPEQERPLLFSTDITRADVYFLIDTTGSMGGPIGNVQSSLGTLSTTLQARIPDLQLGVGRFDDFPFGSFGGQLAGRERDRPFEHIQDITDSVPAVQAALNSLNLRWGGDEPESQVEGIFQAASGAGGNWSSGGASFSLPMRTCPDGGVGYPCFRRGALPIIVLVSDANWHNNEAGGFPYSGINPPPATFNQAVAAVNGIGGRFIGVMTGSQQGESSYRAMATQTGSVDGAGQPLVYRTAGDNRVSDDIVAGVETLIGSTPQDVSTRRENMPGNPDDFDATLFIQRIVPVAAFRADGSRVDDVVMVPLPDPTTFQAITPGLTVEFRVEFYNDVRNPPATEVHRARIFVVGNGVADLSQREVYIVVPAGDDPVVLI